METQQLQRLVDGMNGIQHREVLDKTGKVRAVEIRPLPIASKNGNDLKSAHGEKARDVRARLERELGRRAAAYTAALVADGYGCVKVRRTVTGRVTVTLKPAADERQVLMSALLRASLTPEQWQILRTVAGIEPPATDVPAESAPAQQ